MAYEQQQLQDPNAPSNTGPISTSGGTPGTPAMGMQGGQSATPPKATSSGRFTNIQKYMKANQPVNYAGQIGGKLESQGADIRAGIQAGQQQAQGQGQQELQRLGQAQQVVQQAVADPTQVAANQNQAAEVQRLREGQFTQNVGLQNEAQLANQAQNLASQANLAGTEQGRFELLRQQFGQQPGKTYNMGQQRLDQLLLQGKPGQLGQLQQQAQQVAQGTQAELAGAQANLADLSGQLQTAGKSAQQYAQEQLGGAVTAQQQQLQQAAQAKQAERQQQYQQLQQALQTGQISAEQAQQLGFSPEEIAKGEVRAYGADINQLLGAAPGEVTVGQVSTPEQQAKMQALAQLSGRQDVSGFANVAEQPLQNVGSEFLSGLRGAQQQAEGTDEYKYLQSRQGYIPKMQVLQDASQSLAGLAKGGAVKPADMPAVQKSIASLQATARGSLDRLAALATGKMSVGSMYSAQNAAQLTTGMTPEQKVAAVMSKINDPLLRTQLNKELEPRDLNERDESSSLGKEVARHNPAATLAKAQQSQQAINYGNLLKIMPGAQ